MSTIRHRLTHLEQQQGRQMPITFTIRSDHSTSFVEGYDADGAFHFTIHIDRRDEAPGMQDLAEQGCRP